MKKNLLALLVCLCPLWSLSTSAYAFDYLGILKDGAHDASGALINGLNGVEQSVVSPDGKHLYVTGYFDDSLSVFDVTTPEQPHFLQVLKDGSNGVLKLDGAVAVAIAPEGDFVYVGSLVESAISIFRRDPNTGFLTLHDVLIQGQADSDGTIITGIGRFAGFGIQNIKFTSDGEYFYVASNYTGGAFFKKDAMDRHLFIGQITAPVNYCCSDVVITPDKKYLFATAAWSDHLFSFSIDPATKALTQIASYRDGVGGVNGLNRAESITISPDGKHLYAAAYYDDSLSGFRIESDGTLTYLETLFNGQTDQYGNSVTGLNGAIDVLVSNEGRWVYVASSLDNAVTVFGRDIETGLLRFDSKYRDGASLNGNTIDGLYRAKSISQTPSSNYIYVAGRSEDEVAIFETDAGIDSDGDGYTDTDEIDSGSDPNDAESKPQDNDIDFISDFRDPDDDNDGHSDEYDAFPFDPNEWRDLDTDGIGDNSDIDIDGDGFENMIDAFPEDPSEWADMDGDGIGDNSDQDRDGDGVANDHDVFPNNVGEHSDLDGDGIGDNSDLDIDGDGMPNAWEDSNGFDAHNASDAGQDNDNDGFSNLAEYLGDSDPQTGSSYPSLAIDLFQASPGVVSTPGTPVELRWSTQGATSVRLTNDVNSSEITGLPTEGIAMVSPEITTNYELKIVGPNGEDSESVRVSLNLPAPNKRWSEKLNLEDDNQIKTSVTVDERGAIYVGSQDKNFYKIYADGSEEWRHENVGVVMGKSVLTDSMVIFGSSGNGEVLGRVYALGFDKSEKWVVETESAVIASPIVQDQWIYAVSYEGVIYQIDMQTGVVNWTYELPSGQHIVTPPSYVEGQNALITRTVENSLYAIRPPAGEVGPSSSHNQLLWSKTFNP